MATKQLFSRKWTLLSSALSIVVYSATVAKVHHLYTLGLWRDRSPVALHLASLQLAIGIIAMVIAIVAIRKEPKPPYGFLALVLGALLFGSAAV